MRSTSPPPVEPDLARALVERIVRTGLGLATLLDVLLDQLPEDAFPGEQLFDVLVEMITGTVRPAVDAAGPAVVEAAIALLGAADDRTMRDLVTAAALVRERHR
jgi:hypothetical protein